MFQNVTLSLMVVSYIYPHTFRSKMADLFKDRDCMNWWLPNNENYPAIIRSIRKFVEERTAPAKDMSSEDLRDMKAIFSSMKLDEGEASQNSVVGRETGGGSTWQEYGQSHEDGDYGTYEQNQELWRDGHGGGDFGGPSRREYR